VQSEPEEISTMKLKSTIHKASSGILFGSLMFMLIACTQSSYAQGNELKNQYRQISMEEYSNKVAGGWLGQAIAVLWGQWTEGIWQGEMIPFELNDWYKTKATPESTPEVINWAKSPPVAITYEPEPWGKLKEYIKDFDNWETWTPDQMCDQDDLYLEFMFLYSIRSKGLDVSATEIAVDWVKYLDKSRTWGANHNAYSNFEKGIWPPLSGHPDHSRYGDAIDFQIESDLFGLINPGMPRISNFWCDRVGHIMNYGDGVYAGMAMAAMYGEAFFENDPQKLAEYSLRAIPAECGYARMVRDVLDLHQKYPDWKDAWRALQPKWAMKDGKLVPGLDVRMNGAYVYMGLLYGGGDFLKSMNISMRCGADSDCNPSSVAGILGTVLGMDGIPDKWAILRDLPIDNMSISEIYPKSIDWDDIVEATVEVGKWNILHHGAFIENDTIFIPIQTPTSPPLEQTSWIAK
jgi:hypothetical protein